MSDYMESGNYHSHQCQSVDLFSGSTCDLYNGHATKRQKVYDLKTTILHGKVFGQQQVHGIIAKFNYRLGRAARSSMPYRP